MKILYFDCFSGISGDMFLGAMLDIGVKEDYLRQQLNLLNVSGYQLDIYQDQRKGITGTKAKVTLVNDHDEHNHNHHDEHHHNHHHEHHHNHHHEHHHNHDHEHHYNHDHEHHHEHHDRNLYNITELINNSALNSNIKNLSIKMFKHIAEAEAKIHGKTIEDVHFHEVGAIDSIIDIVGAAICIDYIKVNKIIFSTIAVGGGFVHCAHGKFPVPAPATVEILKGIKITSGDVEKELTTPTGAAIVKVIANEFTNSKNFTISKIGYGIGHRDNPIPNVLRVFVGEVEDSLNNTPYYLKESAKVIECNIDDGNPEIYPYVIEQLFDAGAMDVWLTPIVMKKGRSALTISVMCHQELVNKMTEILFFETSTIGVRTYDVDKVMLKRNFITINTPYGEVVFKTTTSGDNDIRFKPEYEDCKRIASTHNIPLNKVYELVNKLFKSPNTTKKEHK